MYGVSKWVVFDKMGKRVKTVTIKHKSNLHYIELDKFEADLKAKKLYANRLESIEQPFAKAKTLKEKLISLGWEFDSKGEVIADW